MSQLVRSTNHARDGAPAFSGWDPSRLLTSFLGWNPSMSDSGLRIDDRDDEYIITADMPGVDDTDIDLTFDRGTLTIVGKRENREYRYSYTLGLDVDASRISATLEHGVLTVVAPKLPAAKPRRIPIATAKSKGQGTKRRFFFRKKR